MNTQTNTKSLNITLWILQALLGAAFIFFGLMNLFRMMPSELPAALVFFIGISELAGGIGLIIPSLLRIQPRLTGWAAMGIFVIMILATGFHISREEYTSLTLPVIFGLMSAFVAWGRIKKVPISAKS